MGVADDAPPGTDGSLSGLWAIVVAAGSGSRFGAELPKQYASLGGQRVLDHSLQAMRRWCEGRVVLVVADAFVGDAEPLAGIVVRGGSSRTESVRNGLDALPDDAQFVLIHDAARPLVDHTVVRSLMDTLATGAVAAIPGVAVTDTVKRVKDGWVVETINRDELSAVQTPQAFVVSALRAAHAAGLDATDDAALMEQAGHNIAVVSGAAQMRKVTTLEDLRFLEGFLA
jgi:2-C-methyl-D-erythritol 4-phosphate cytidylyltransferase